MILLTGGSGRLGVEIKKRLDVYAPTRQELDITKEHFDIDTPELIIHAAAYTDVDGAEYERDLCYRTNVLGTRHLSELGAPMLYISTDSVFDGLCGDYNEEDLPYPKNFYSLTKLLGEREVKEGWIIRCSPKARPWGPEAAYTDRFFSAEYVDQIAEKIVYAVENLGHLPRVVHIGSKRRSHYEMAIETVPDVLEAQAGYPLMSENRALRGQDLSLDTSLWESLL